MRARQKAAEAQTRRRTWLGLGLGAVAAVGGAFALFRWQDRAVAARPAISAPAPTALAAVVPAEVALERAETAPSAPATAEAPAAPSEMPAVAAAEAPAPVVAATAPAVAAVAPASATAAPSAGAAHAQCLADFGQLNWKAASDSCALAYEQAPDATLALKIAHAQFARDNVARAGAWASKSLELGGNDADAYVLIGHAERRAGHLKSALTAYRRYLQASPQGWHARDVRGAVRGLKAKLAESAGAEVAEAPAAKP